MESDDPMFNTDPPRRADLPTGAQLARSTAIAAAVAAALLVFVVLPSEYAIDPTGAGRALGLTRMGEIKMQLAAEAAAEAEATAAAASRAGAGEAMPPELPVSAPAANEAGAAAAPEVGRTDEVRFSLTPGQGAEYKLVMRHRARAQFSWSTDGAPINVDAHGSAPGQRVSYGIIRGITGNQGELVAAFDGDHGWFFRNRSAADVTVTLRTEGDYAELKKVL